MKIYDTSRREKVDFSPSDPDRIKVYVCGPTVYDRIHLGNGRAAIVFDLLRRVLEDEFGEGSVRMVRNLTDVDDKINARAAQRGVSIRDVTEETTRWFHEDVAALGTLRPHAEPRATEHVPSMVKMIQKIIQNGHAYVQNGHVFFDVRSDPHSGGLFRSGMTGEPSEDGGHGKRSPEDFVLWKPSGPGLPAWESPWGPGRPGWHIECSAMVRDEFNGAGVDIHGGGSDLQFPHHENEDAQHRCAHPGETFAKHWMHNGMITVNGKKMAKSANNFTTVRDLLDKGVGGDAIRLALLTGHYSGSLDFSDELISTASVTVSRWRQMTGDVVPVRDEDLASCLRDDLSTPRAIARMHALERSGDVQRLAFGFQLFGLRDAEPAPRHQASAERVAAVNEIVRLRDIARAEKRWADSDALRSEAESLGFKLRDVKGGSTVWEYDGDRGSDDFTM